MIKLSNLKLSIDYTENTVTDEISKMLRVPPTAILKYEFSRLAVDARKKNNVHYTATVNVKLNEKIIK